MLAPKEVSDSGLRGALFAVALGDLRAVLSSDLGYRPLGRLLLKQGQGISLLNGAQLLLLCLLELRGVSDLRMGK